MVSVLTSSAVSKALLFLALCSVWLLPDLALAKHAGILPGTTSSMGWSKAYTETIINQAWATGGAPNISDAFTINGLLGPSYKLQLLNKRIANHTLKPFKTDIVLTTPGQTPKRQVRYVS
ncbi:hypothetical protein V6N13_087593 [Hibiscus sabdariffa]